jgi:hypothetical protein
MSGESMRNSNVSASVIRGPDSLDSVYKYLFAYGDKPRLSAWKDLPDTQPQVLPRNGNKPDATLLNALTENIDGEAIIDLDIEGVTIEGHGPDIQRCAIRNFPPEAKAFVREALVPIELTVDKDGIVRDAKSLHVVFASALPPELKSRMVPIFLNAAQISLLGQRCPIYRTTGRAHPYRLEVVLNYVLSD